MLLRLIPSWSFMDTVLTQLQCEVWQANFEAFNRNAHTHAYGWSLGPTWILTKLMHHHHPLLLLILILHCSCYLRGTDSDLRSEGMSAEDCSIRPRSLLLPFVAQQRNRLCEEMHEPEQDQDAGRASAFPSSRTSSNGQADILTWTGTLTVTILSRRGSCWSLCSTAREGETGIPYSMLFLLNVHLPSSLSHSHTHLMDDI